MYNKYLKYDLFVFPPSRKKGENAQVKKFLSLK